ncbi:hypothetical protein CCHR01_16202 [Colletotrichum chrysophilum]|uniref:Uncharacterized protein n=1 Tax=Colletotrichum chrysophilum TaxID=1836956 RepID=A0AAD9EA93_9PEZI|nr:hypothetical protein CCHR01_16202 [Colletotrichum chrysophilum]
MWCEGATGPGSSSTQMRQEADLPWLRPGRAPRHHFLRYSITVIFHCNSPSTASENLQARLIRAVPQAPSQGCSSTGNVAT